MNDDDDNDYTGNWESDYFDNDEEYDTSDGISISSGGGGAFASVGSGGAFASAGGGGAFGSVGR